MDRPRVGDQHHEKPVRADTEIPNSWTLMGIGGKDEKAKDQPVGKFQIPSTKFQINHNYPNSKLETELFWSFGIGAWNLFEICNLEIGI